MARVGARQRRHLGGVGAPVAGDEDEHVAPVAVEDERLDDPVEVAADGAGGVLGGRALRSGNSSTRASAPASRSAALTRRTGSGQESAASVPPIVGAYPDAADTTAAQASEMNWASSKPSAWTRSRSSGGAGVSIANAISAFPPSFVRETAMFAMFTPCLAEHRPDPPDHAGHVGVAEEDEVRGELEVDPEAERAREEEPRLGADRRSGDGDVVGADLDEVHVVARDAEALLDDLHAALGGDHRRVHVVHDLVDAALEDAVERADGEQPRVVVGQRAVGGDRDPLRPAAEELDREPAELRRERDEGAEQLEVGGVDDRDVDRVRDRAGPGARRRSARRRSRPPGPAPRRSRRRGAA